jgi:hypothetical protein
MIQKAEGDEKKLDGMGKKKDGIDCYECIRSSAFSLQKSAIGIWHNSHFPTADLHLLHSAFFIF